MKRTQLIDQIAIQADITKAEATRALQATIDSIKTVLNTGESVSLPGFGTFLVSERAPRTGRNPRSGTSIKIGATRSPRFRASKAFKDALK
ncbi:MAG: HU family DNA-binding protein [Rhodoferax sp.]|nr:HU family DNA-binding protein [Rhodoferax sp.]MCF8211077.1 HU family DNA-binding protein [Rhodoferax sp.]